MWHKRILAGFVLVTVTLVGAQGAGLPDEVADYFNWTRANPQKDLEASAHPLVKDIYVNDVAVPGALEANFPYAEGSVLIKERLDPEVLSVTTLYTMRKTVGFDPDNGNWEYGVFEREATGAFGGGWLSVAAAEGCISCHTDAADTDYTFLSYLGE